MGKKEDIAGKTIGTTGNSIGTIGIKEEDRALLVPRHDITCSKCTRAIIMFLLLSGALYERLTSSDILFLPPLLLAPS